MLNIWVLHNLPPKYSQVDWEIERGQVARWVQSCRKQRLSCPLILKDWYYNDGVKFEYCKAEFRRCTTGTDCQVCGYFNKQSKAYWLIWTLGRITVRLLVDSICSGISFLKGGGMRRVLFGYLSFERLLSSSCVACQTPEHRWLHTPTRLWKPCGSGCSVYSSDTSCAACVDSNHFVQLDGETCAAHCRDREAQITKSNPKRCEACSAHCKACEEDKACVGCEPGSYQKFRNLPRIPCGMLWMFISNKLLQMQEYRWVPRQNIREMHSRGLSELLYIPSLGAR